MYRKIDTRYWTDPRVRGMSPIDKLVFLYLVTGPYSHMSGLYYLPFAAACDELGIAKSDLGCSIDTLSIHHLAEFDRSTSEIWVVNMLTYQGGGRKVYKAVKDHLGSVHSRDLVRDFVNHYSKLGISFGYGIDTVSIPYPPVAVKEQEQDQKQEQEQDCAPVVHMCAKSRTFTTHPTPPDPDLRNINPDTEQALTELRQHHADLWGLNPRGFVQVDDHAMRIARVLAEYGREGCEQIQRGHRKREAESRFRGWRYAYPHIKGQPTEPDWDWVAEYHKAGGAVHHHTQSETTETPEQRMRRIQAEDDKRRADPEVQARAAAAAAELQRMKGGQR